MDEKKVLKESNQNLISFLHELSEKDLIWKYIRLWT
jgi:hypothetical protein